MNQILLRCVLIGVYLQGVAYAQTTDVDFRGVMGLQQKVINRSIFRGQGPTVADELQIENSQLVQLAALREELAIYTREQLRQPPDFETRQKLDGVFIASIEQKLKSILNDEQRQRLDQLDLQQEGAMALLRPEIGRKVGLSAAHEILNEQQRATWSEMIGKPSAAVQSRNPIVPGVIPAVPAAVPLSAETSIAFFQVANAVVRADLQLTDEQFAKLAEKDQKYREASQRRVRETDVAIERARDLLKEVTDAMRAYRTMCAETLTDGQKKRVGEIQFQSNLEQSLLTREFRQGAKLSDDQVNSLDSLLDHRKRDPAAPKSRALDRAHVEYRQETLRRGMNLLSDEQREVWNRMAGAPIPNEGFYNPPAKTGE